MSCALLFSFHIRPETCLARLAQIRALNPGRAVYGLFSGDPETFPAFGDSAALCDHCWVHPSASPGWLWRNYDKVIVAWFEQAGRSLPWDHLFVHAWDLLLAEPIDGYLAAVTQKRMLLPGVRPAERMDQEIPDPFTPPERPGNWDWLHRETDRLAAFQQYLLSVFGQLPPLMCEVSPFAVLSRDFCESYTRVVGPIPGFNEYRFPTVAGLLGYEFVEAPLPKRFWRCYNAEKQEIPAETVASELSDPEGARLFHPVYSPLSEILPR